MRTDNIRLLQETLEILEKGYYFVNGKRIDLKLSKERMEKVHVLLPNNVSDICSRTDFEHVYVMGRCGYSCPKTDSFSAAIELANNKFLFNTRSEPVLVLNFANPVNPGGGVKCGVSAQEADSCRKSSLLLSLESDKATKYYQYNRDLNSDMGSDAMIFTPEVEIIRDADGSLLENTVIVSVLTCAAPYVADGLRGLSDEQYKQLVLNRITGMLKCAAYFQYEVLVLGAWGCGAFGNDAAVISDLFYKALKEFNFDGMREKDMFRRIEFAVRGKDKGAYNYKEFYRNFGGDNFYNDENQLEIEQVNNNIKKTEVYLDKIQGALFGGAVGDALGFPIEFLPEEDIFFRYGEEGIQEYKLDKSSGKALISDDTQMSLFTANGILVGDTRGALRGISAAPHAYIADAYQDWLITQESTFEEGSATKRYSFPGGVSWLLDVPELYHRRAPGTTCVSALETQKIKGRKSVGTIKNHINNSKGCGGIMRVAPFALKHYPFTTSKDLDLEGAEIAAITHGHSLGYMPAAVLVHIIRNIVYSSRPAPLKEIILEARDFVSEIFADDWHISTLTSIINRAVELSENNDFDLDNIHRIGAGWVAEETLGIALYCSLRHQDDFSAGIIAAVNHSGDSDSTGAVTGNILGALLGYHAIEEKWKNNLELSDVILEMATDLCHGCQMDEYSSYKDPAWMSKYVHMRRSKSLIKSKIPGKH